MNDLKPGALAALGGGVLLIISTFLDWFGPFSVWEGVFFGFTGFIMLVIGAAVAAIAAVRAFAPQVSLPDQVLGLSLDQVTFALGFSVAVYTFGLLFRDESAKIGTILALVASIAIAAGGYLESNTPASAEPPRTI